jgi:hypothetical protein
MQDLEQRLEALGEKREMLQEAIGDLRGAVSGEGTCSEEEADDKGLVCVKVRNLDQKVNAMVLGRTFEQVGDVREAEISYDRDDRHAGWGYVVFGCWEDAGDAVQRLNGVEMCGRTLEVQLGRGCSEERWELEDARLHGRESEDGSVSEDSY